MKTHDVIYAPTHAVFLNKLLHTNYKAWMKVRYDLPSGYTIWMIRLDGKQSKVGWTNSVTDYGNKIHEMYTGSPMDKLSSHYGIPLEKRLVFCIYDDPTDGRRYTFLGSFELDNKSNSNHRIWNKISDYYNF